MVTFDIFDTLIHRKLRAPVDVFEAVRHSALQKQLSLLNHDLIVSFTHDRIRAEYEARESLISNTAGEGEVNFDEIYDRYQQITCCSPEVRQMLQTLELAVEKKFLFASETGLNLFNELKATSNKVAFVSDMYLPSRWLAQTLEEKGFVDATSVPIFVSGEYRKSKHSGALYREVARVLNVSLSKSWMHVGDNIHSDVRRAEELGLSTTLADWSKVDNRRLVSSIPQRDYLVHSFLDSLKLPQLKQFVPEGEYERVGYHIFGPLIFGYLMWLMMKAKQARLDHLVFVARDGWLPHQLYTELKHLAGLNHTTSSYLHFSRRAGYQLGLREWDIGQAWVPFGGKVSRSMSECLETVGYDAQTLRPVLERFGFDERTVVDETKRTEAHALLTTMFKQVLDKSRNARSRYKKYFDRHFQKGRKTGIVDIGWNGSIQRYLVSIISPDLSKEEVVGLYLGLHSSAIPNRELGLNMSGWMSDYGTNQFVERYLQSGGVELLEFALTADHGTTLGYREDEDGEIVPVLEALLTEEEDYRDKAMKVQTGIRSFVSDHKYLLDLFSPDMLATTAWVTPFEKLVTDPTDDEVRLLAGLSHSDIPGTTSSRLVLAARQKRRTRKSKRRLAIARQAAFWKAAFDKLNA